MVACLWRRPWSMFSEMCYQNQSHISKFWRYYPIPLPWVHSENLPRRSVSSANKRSPICLHMDLFSSEECGSGFGLVLARGLTIQTLLPSTGRYQGALTHQRSYTWFVEARLVHPTMLVDTDNYLGTSLNFTCAKRAVGRSWLEFRLILVTATIIINI